MVRSVRRLVAVLALVALALPVRAAGVDPSADGPFAVGVTTLPFIDGSRSRTLVTEVWYPARSGGRDAPARRGRYPLVLVVGGTADTTLAFDLFAAPFFAALPAPAFLVKVIGGTHSGFTDMDSHLSAAQLARQQALTRRYATAFLRRYLARDRRFARFLAPADAVAEGTDVELTARVRGAGSR